MAIGQEYKHKQEALYKQATLPLGAYKSPLLARQQAKKAQLTGLLAPQQKEQIARSKQQASENMQVMAAARLERLKIHLQLTDDQETKLKAQESAMRTQLQSIRENENLLPDQKREQMIALFSKQKDALASVLTPDQLAKLNDMRGNGRKGPGVGK